jgi:hypothetical protein
MLSTSNSAWLENFTQGLRLQGADRTQQREQAENDIRRHEGLGMLT